MTKNSYANAVYIAMILVLLVAFWLRATELNSYPPGISNDEAVNAIDAFHIFRTGNFPMYEDQGRPEPFFRLVQALGAASYGTSVWAFRLTSAFVGVLTIAAAYWAALVCLRDIPDKTIRQLAALLAAISLAVALGHITVTRSTYRAVPQPLFMFLTTGFLMRGLQNGKWRDFLLAGVFIALALYTYTAAYMIPIAFVPLGINQLIFKTKRWRHWMPRLILVGAVVALLMAPVILLLLDNPQSVIGRASSVAQTGPSLETRLRAMVLQFTELGDENPQYNVAHAPILPPIVVPFFALGLISLVLRIRQPSSWYLGALLVLMTIPAVATDEITHGLRVFGEFGVFPIVAGSGLALLLLILRRIKQLPQQALYSITGIGVLILLMGGSVIAHQAYVDFWKNPDKWARNWPYGLNHSEWFFRPDRRDFTQWLTTQAAPLLIPVDEISVQNMRVWLLPAYPAIVTADDSFELPENTQLVVPWNIETDDIRRDTRHYALLNDQTITLLPPISQEAHKMLLEGIDEAAPITRTGGKIEFLGRVQPVPDTVQLSYEPSHGTDAPLAVFGEDELYMVSWRGPDTLSGGGETGFTLEWSTPQNRVGHEYWSYLQLQTQDWQRVAGDDVLMLRWLYPTTLWHTGDVVPDHHSLEVPDDLPFGGYRLVAGVYPTNQGPIPAQSMVGEVINNGATIGWVKVPLPEQTIPPNTTEMDVTIQDAFALRAYEVTQDEDNQQVILRLYWQGLVNRPEFDATVFVHALDENTQIATQSDIRPYNGQYPTFIWDEGEIVMTEHVLNVADVDTDTLTLTVGLYVFDATGQARRLRVLRGDDPLPNNVAVLGQLQDLIAGK